MKIRSLLLGSVAAAGLSTGAYAADLGVLTSLDVCDALGLSGLTISSDTNCLQISGSVSYEFKWGDYAGEILIVSTEAGNFEIIDNDGTPDHHDWYSKVEAWLKFVGTADSDFGPAKAVIKIKDVQEWVVENEVYIAGKEHVPGIKTPGTGGDHTFGPIFDEAYVAIGDSTVIMAGKKGSIWNKGDDEPFNWLGLFNSEKVDTGVNYKVSTPDGGHVIQIVSDLGNGVSVAGGLENLNGAGASGGTAIGVISYAGSGFTAHITGVAGGILDGTVENYAVHAGFTGTFDMFRIRAAIAADNTGYYNALATAEATFDIFKIAISGEVADDTGAAAGTDWGVGGSISATVTDGITINLGGRYYDDASSTAGWQVAAQLVAAVTETLTATGEVGVYGKELAGVHETIYYGAVTLAWAPGGGFTSSIKGEATSEGAYRATFKAAKSFE